MAENRSAVLDNLPESVTLAGGHQTIDVKPLRLELDTSVGFVLYRGVTAPLLPSEDGVEATREESHAMPVGLVSFYLLLIAGSAVSLVWSALDLYNFVRFGRSVLEMSGILAIVGSTGLLFEFAIGFAADIKAFKR